MRGRFLCFTVLLLISVHRCDVIIPGVAFGQTIGPQAQLSPAPARAFPGAGGTRAAPGDNWMGVKVIASAIIETTACDDPSGCPALTGSVDIEQPVVQEGKPGIPEGPPAEQWTPGDNGNSVNDITDMNSDEDNGEGYDNETDLYAEDGHGPGNENNFEDGGVDELPEDQNPEYNAEDENQYSNNSPDTYEEYSNEEPTEESTEERTLPKQENPKTNNVEHQSDLVNLDRNKTSPGVAGNAIPGIGNVIAKRKPIPNRGKNKIKDKKNIRHKGGNRRRKGIRRRNNDKFKNQVEQNGRYKYNDRKSWGNSQKRKKLRRALRQRKKEARIDGKQYGEGVYQYRKNVERKRNKVRRGQKEKTEHDFDS